MLSVKAYQDKNGNEPFTKWLRGLKDSTIKARIRHRLDRVRYGNFGDCKSLGGGLYELRLSFGAGYRIYYGREGDRLVILLVGGDKSSQKRDIEKAKIYWNERNKTHA